MASSNPSSSRTDRKTTEKNRRNQMKSLFSKLNSLIPHQSSKGLQEAATSLPDRLDEAVRYIKKLQTNMEKMREKKESLMMGSIERPASSNYNAGIIITGGQKPQPQIEIHETGSALQVSLITGLDSQFMFNETIRALSEGGAEIVNASFSVVDDTIFHIIHSKVKDAAPGFSAARRISERLRKLVEDAC